MISQKAQPKHEEIKLTMLDEYTEEEEHYVDFTLDEAFEADRNGDYFCSAQLQGKMYIIGGRNDNTHNYYAVEGNVKQNINITKLHHLDSLKCFFFCFSLFSNNLKIQLKNQTLLIKYTQSSFLIVYM